MSSHPEDSQVVVPASFVALYLAPGRSRPSAPREEIAARHEACEDLASALTEPARTLLWQLGVAEQDVLQRMQRGLEDEAAGLRPGEAQWVTRRLAEILAWPQPEEASGAQRR